jgi:hypothetical protein
MIDTFHTGTLLPDVKAIESSTVAQRVAVSVSVAKAHTITDLIIDHKLALVARKQADRLRRQITHSVTSSKPEAAATG